MELAFLILGMAVVTFIARYSMIAILGRVQVSPGVTRALEFVPVATFAAIVAPEMFIRAGQFVIGLDNPRFIAGVVAMLVATRTRNFLVTLAFGMSILWIVQKWIGA